MMESRHLTSLRLPGELREALWQRATAERQSLQATLLDALWSYVGQPERIGSHKSHIVRPVSRERREAA